MDERKIYNAVISFPRSGTDYLCTALTSDKRIRYFREYFNPICNKKRDAILRKYFGDERLLMHFNIMNEIDRVDFDDVMRRSWLLDSYNTTKENFSATKYVHFAEQFNLIVLVRKLYHTFPTSRPDYIVPILNSFMIAGPYRSLAQSRELNELRTFIARDVAVHNEHHAGILAHIIQHYVLLFEAERHRTPIVTYEELVQKDGADLDRTISCLTRFGVDPTRVANALRKARKKLRVELGARRQRFLRECSPDWYVKPLQFVLQQSPQLSDAFQAYIFDEGELGASN